MKSERRNLMADSKAQKRKHNERAEPLSFSMATFVLNPEYAAAIKFGNSLLCIKLVYGKASHVREIQH